MASTNACFVLIYFMSTTWWVNGHLPLYTPFEWAEPDAVEYSSPGRESSKLTRQQALERVTAVRTVLSGRGVDAYIVPTADAHNSQYIAPSDARREWVSGLSGSSGTALVSATHALVWTDSRYFTQFYMQVDTTVWSLMRQGTDSSIQSWLVANMPSGSVVALDPTTFTRSAWTPLENALKQVNVTLKAIDINLIDEARRLVGDPPPPRPNEPLIAFELNFHGNKSRDKIVALQTDIERRGASALVLTALDDIAYTLNIRGTDIPFNPVFFSYFILRTDLPSPRNKILFWGDGILPPLIAQHLALEGTELEARPYIEIFEYLRNMSAELSGKTIWLSQGGSHAIFSAAEGDGSTNVLSTVSPVALMKCVKNDVELRTQYVVQHGVVGIIATSRGQECFIPNATHVVCSDYFKEDDMYITGKGIRIKNTAGPTLLGFRSAHKKDGIAVVRFLRWVHEQVNSGIAVTEMDASDKLLDLRDEEAYFMGPSFATIAGAGENGAVIHYQPSPEGPQRVINTTDMLLVDSGGQYKDGTTDITRTRHMGVPSEKQRIAFTRVLKGQILLGTAVFPKRISGHTLETLARKSLWDVGLNYGHGTGHGVGHFLNVHEGPSGILSSPITDDPGIVPGMIFSNEPGYYEVGEFGIRHEDLVEVIEMNAHADHIMADGMIGDFDGRGAMAFYTISLAPHQTSVLDISLLTDFEIKFINDYHARVLKTLGPILLERNLREDYDWLEKECAPITRSAANILTSTPLLALFSIFSMWHT